MYIRFKDGKPRAFTLSYDDGTVQDKRLMDIFDKYGLKATFNINSGRFLPENVEREQYGGNLKLSEAKELYINSGHEIAVHTLTHPFLTQIKSQEAIDEIIEDRHNLEREFQTIVRGMAYPYGTYNDDVIGILRDCGICYSRTVQSTGGFYLPQNWLTLHPTCHHNDAKLMDYAETFVDTNYPWRKKPLFYVWGHSFEFDRDGNWNIMEEFAKFMSGRDNVWYATNIEIYDYVKAYNSLQVSIDKKMIYNPSAADVWVEDGDEVIMIRAGETIRRN